MMYYKYLYLKKIKAHLKNGGLIAYPVEYCYAIGCDPLNFKALKNLLTLKKRNKDKGLIVISNKYDKIRYLLNEKKISTTLKKDFDQYWPGANTLLLPKNKNVLYLLSGKSKKLAVRVSANSNVAQLCRNSNALVSSSLNFAGFKAVRTYKDALQYKNKVLILSGKTDGYKEPSKIFDLDNNSRLR